MKNTRKTLLATGIALALLAASPSWAETPVAPGQGPMMGGYGPGAAAGIELSDEQRNKMRELQREQFQKNMGLREKMMVEYGQLESLLDADKPDAKAVQEAYDRLHALRKQMIESRLQARHKMYDLLNDDQRKAWRSQRRAWGPMGMMGQGYGPGYGYWPMGPGMMGPGYGPWWLDE